MQSQRVSSSPRFGWLLFVVAAITTIHSGHAWNNRKLAIQFISYENFQGHLFNGTCCDVHGASGWCPPDLCDTAFDVCIGRTSNDSCELTFLTTAIWNNNTVSQFGLTLDSYDGNSTRSLIVPTIPFEISEDLFLSMAAIEMDPRGPNQSWEEYWRAGRPLIGNYSTVIRPTHNEFSLTPNWTTIEFNNGVARLVVNVSTFCARYWYGDNCDVRCMPMNNSRGHYGCDPLTGNKTCHTGYEGPNCTQIIDLCKSSPCLNGGACATTGPGVYNCTCVSPYFRGTNCEIALTTTPPTTTTPTTTMRITAIQGSTTPYPPMTWAADSVMNGDILLTCVGGNVSLYWRLKPGSPTDEIFDVQWFYERRSHELISLLETDRFVVLPAFSGRLYHVTGPEVVLTNVTPLDAGEYSVEVVAGDFGNQKVYRFESTIRLEVADLPTLQNGGLLVQEEPQAVFDPNTAQWAVKLTCGNFSSLGTPPATVVWKTPSGKTLPSTSYANGQFSLLLSTPMEGGTYTCNTDYPGDKVNQGCLLGPATYNINSSSTTIKLLQAEVQDLKNKLMTCDAKPGVHCMQCGDLNSNRPCTEAELNHQRTGICDSLTPFCMNDVFVNGSSTFQYRRCVNEATCDALWSQSTALKPQCLLFDQSTLPSNDLECHFCCYGDKCNDQDVPSLHTLHHMGH